MRFWSGSNARLSKGLIFLLINRVVVDGVGDCGGGGGGFLLLSFFFFFFFFFCRKARTHKKLFSLSFEAVPILSLFHSNLRVYVHHESISKAFCPACKYLRQNHHRAASTLRWNMVTGDCLITVTAPFGAVRKKATNNKTAQDVVLQQSLEYVHSLIGFKPRLPFPSRGRSDNRINVKM